MHSQPASSRTRRPVGYRPGRASPDGCVRRERAGAGVPALARLGLATAGISPNWNSGFPVCDLGRRSQRGEHQAVDQSVDSHLGRSPALGGDIDVGTRSGRPRQHWPRIGPLTTRPAGPSSILHYRSGDRDARAAVELAVGAGSGAGRTEAPIGPGRDALEAQPVEVGSVSHGRARMVGRGYRGGLARAESRAVGGAPLRLSTRATSGLFPCVGCGTSDPARTGFSPASAPTC